MSAISSACSPVSGWETSRSSVFTPSALAYSGSSACSASMNAAMPAGGLRVGHRVQGDRGLTAGLRAVDLDDPAARADRRRRARRRGRSSRWGSTPIGGRVSSPSRITEPLPWFFSIWARASSSAFSRSGAVISCLADLRSDAVSEGLRAFGGVSCGEPRDNRMGSPRQFRRPVTVCGRRRHVVDSIAIRTPVRCVLRHADRDLQCRRSTSGARVSAGPAAPRRPRRPRARSGAGRRRPRRPARRSARRARRTRGRGDSGAARTDPNSSCISSRNWLIRTTSTVTAAAGPARRYRVRYARSPAAGDPTGFSSPLGQAVVLLALLTSLVLLLRWWWQQRRR